MTETPYLKLARAANGAHKALRHAAVLPEAEATELMRDALRALLNVVGQVIASGQVSATATDA